MVYSEIRIVFSKALEDGEKNNETMVTRKIKILLIEDEKMLVEMYKSKFEKEGFEMITAFDVKEGLKITKKEKPDLILLDILLPTENGISFLEKMKRDPEIANIFVVALSNYDKPSIRREVRELGARAYLIKTDFTPNSLVQEVKKYLPR